MSIKKDFIDQLVAFFCMMLLTTYCYTSGGVKRYIMPSFVSVIIVLLLCLFGMVYLNRGKIIIKKTFLLLVFLAILVIIFNRNANFEHLIFENDISIIAALIFLLIGMKNNVWHKYFVGFTFFWAIVHSVFTILEFAIPGFYSSTILPLFQKTTYYDDLVWVFSQGKIPGIAGHFSTNGMYLSVGLLVITVCFMLRSSKRKILLFLLILFTASSLLFTGKRGVLIAAATGVALAYYLYNSNKPTTRFFKIIIIVLIIVLGFTLASQYIPQLNNIFERFNETMARGDVTTGRSKLYSIAWDLFGKNTFFGIGWDEYKYYYMFSNNQFLNVHNVYLQLLTENGIIGCIPFFALFGYMYYRVIRFFVSYVKNSQIRDPQCESALVLSVGMQTFFLIYCITGNPLYDPQVFYPYIFCCTMGEYYITKTNSRGKI